MELHGNAKLTPGQRSAMKRRYEAGESYRQLAKAYGVNVKTVGVWVHREDPHDRACGAKTPRTVITEDYRQAVMAYRTDHPQAGPITIAAALLDQFPQARKGTVYTILHAAGLCGPRIRTPKPPPQAIPTGRHRMQMDVQQLPAVQGGKGFEYKISVIHTRTRMKYSEIHPQATSETVADVLRHAMDRLPPFIWPGPTTR